MLFKTIDELIAGLPVNVSFKFDVIAPMIRGVERDFIIDILGEQEYGALEASYQGDSMTAEQAALLPYCQLAIAYMAFMKYVPVGSVNISDSGIHIKSNENVKSAFSWQVDNLNRALEEEGYQCLGALLKFLWAHPDDYPFWDVSENKGKYRAHYLNHAEELNEYVDIKNSSLTFWLLRSSLRKVEDLQIAPVLDRWESGKHGFLLGEIMAGETLTGDDAAVVELVKPALAHLALAHGVQSLSLEIGSMGVVEKSMEGLEQMHTRKPAKVENRYSYLNSRLDDGNAYLDLLTQKIDELIGATDDDEGLGRNNEDRGIYAF